MEKVFLCYRRDDSAYAAWAIWRRMARSMGGDNVFRDQDSLELGRPYARRIAGVLEVCDVMIAVIGSHWLDADADADGPVQRVTSRNGRRRPEPQNSSRSIRPSPAPLSTA